MEDRAGGRRGALAVLVAVPATALVGTLVRVASGEAVGAAGVRGLLQTAAVVLAAGLALRVRRHRQRRRVRHGYVEVVVRDPASDHRGLGPRWRSVRARPVPAALELSSAGSGILADGPLLLLVLDLRATGRTLGWTATGAGPDTPVLEVSTPDGVVELGVDPEHARWLRRRLAGEVRPGAD